MNTTMYFKDGNIKSRPNIPVSNPTDATYLEYGWIPYVLNRPDYDSATHRIEKADITVEEDKAIQQWDVIELTEKEKEKRRKERQKAKQREKLPETVKALKKRITEATDYKDLKDKVSKVENSKDSPTKWSDKVELLEGEYIDHKGTIYVVLQDHTASKDNEPPQEELYEVV